MGYEQELMVMEVVAVAVVEENIPIKEYKITLKGNCHLLIAIVRLKKN
jgi:hypothetical protein